MLKKYSEFISFPIELWTEKTECPHDFAPPSISPHRRMHPMFAHCGVEVMLALSQAGGEASFILYTLYVRLPST